MSLVRTMLPRRARRSCGTITALQLMTLFLMAGFVITATALGSPIWLAGAVATALLRLVLQGPLLRLPWQEFPQGESA
ncbi:hypothetical protein [Amycolatopsis cihanbeyliensis]|uniref:Uncharacterized protein n=1 Tax=Amycolatopsis cihanbeyliensis TaxID=1128664 RepID=A0A542DLI2_AMYCI|nr:hypothetical protein [Amycolatopsis cihanbeyliensis]TQJ03938.1 hypothetical protein FB471_3713 [Amycolatopsis cihanbeyliensis]